MVVNFQAIHAGFRCGANGLALLQVRYHDASLGSSSWDAVAVAVNKEAAATKHIVGQVWGQRKGVFQRQAYVVSRDYRRRNREVRIRYAIKRSVQFAQGCEGVTGFAGASHIR